MPIEPDILVQVMNLSPENVLDLVNTVDTATLINRQLIASPKDRVTIALVMLSHAQTLLELCDCNIKTEITNPAWTSSAIYETGANNMKENL